MHKQTSQQMAASSTKGTVGKSSKFAAAIAAVIVMMLLAAGSATAGTASSNAGAQNQNVNVVNTPTVNVGNTPTVNATIAAPGPLTNVGRLASQQVALLFLPSCPSNWDQLNADGSLTCFDISNYPGQTLIITDVDSVASGTVGSTCITHVDAPHMGNSDFILSFAVAGGDSLAVKSEHFTTGAKIAVNPIAFSNCGILVLWMRGYLVPNQ